MTTLASRAASRAPDDNRAAAPQPQEPTTSSLDGLTGGQAAPQTDSSSNPAAPLLPTGGN